MVFELYQLWLGFALVVYSNSNYKSNGVKINKDTIVEVWKDYVHIHYNDTLAAVTKAGYRAILAAPWYLNRITYGYGLKS